MKVEEKDKNGKVIIKEIIVPDERLNASIGDESLTLEDVIPSHKTIEDVIFGEKETGYSNKMIQYLNRLSVLQKEVLNLISIGFKSDEILLELHINKKQYDDCYAAIHSYRNISILF